MVPEHQPVSQSNAQQGQARGVAVVSDRTTLTAVIDEGGHHAAKSTLIGHSTSYAASQLQAENRGTCSAVSCMGNDTIRLHT